MKNEIIQATKLIGTMLVMDETWATADNSCSRYYRVVDSLTGAFEFVQLVNADMVPYTASENELNAFLQKGEFVGDTTGDHGLSYMLYMTTISFQEKTDAEIDEVLKRFGYENMDAFVIENAATEEWEFHGNGTLDRVNSPSYIIDYILLAELLFMAYAMDPANAFMKNLSWDSAELMVESIINNEAPKKKVR